MESLISVIIPVYMVEKRLERCVESVVRQTYGKLEILLVDDGSPDGSPALCEEWKRRDGRVRVIHQKHQGLSAARNTGIGAASGEYIAFVDGDDYIHPQMLGRMAGAIGTGELCVCGYCEVAEGTEERKPSAQYCGTYGGDEAIECLLWRDEVFWCSSWNKLYKRELFSGLSYPAGKYHEDSFLIHALLHRCRQVTVIADRLYYYVRHDDSITGRPYYIGRLDACEAMLDRADFLVTCGLGHQVLMRTLQNYFWSYVEGFWHRLFARKALRRAYAMRQKELRTGYAAVYAKLCRTDLALWERLFLWGMRRMMETLCFPGLVRELFRKHGEMYGRRKG